MKAFTLVVASLALLLGTVINSSASIVRSSPVSLQHLLAQGDVPHIHGLGVQWRASPLQVGATATATRTAAPAATATATPVPPTPAASPTASNYPDPVTLLKNTVDKYSRIHTARYEVVTDAAQTGQETIHVDAKGDASCKGPSLTATVSAKDTFAGSTQSRSFKGKFIVVKSKAWLKAKLTKSVWKKIKISQVKVFGFTIDQPLVCPSSPSNSGSGSSTTTQLKDLVNSGPETFQGVPVWHLHGTEVSINAQGATSEAALDFLVGQQAFLPYVLTVTVDDSTNHFTITQKQILTHFGERVSIKAPKVGSKTP